MRHSSAVPYQQSLIGGHQSAVTNQRSFISEPSLMTESLQANEPSLIANNDAVANNRAASDEPAISLSAGIEPAINLIGERANHANERATTDSESSLMC
jgi:hypothetical protein